MHLWVGVGADVWIIESHQSSKHVRLNLTDRIQPNKNKSNINISLFDWTTDQVSNILYQ